MTTTIQNKNHDFCHATIELKRSAELAYLDLGARLSQIRRQELYKPFWDSFYEYELEFKWKPSTATRLIQIYETFIARFGIPKEELEEAGGWTVLAEIAPMVKTKKDALEWLEKTKIHSRADIRKDIKEAKGTLAKEEECRHPEAKVRYLRICSCGHTESYYPSGAPKRTGKMVPARSLLRKHGV